MTAPSDTALLQIASADLKPATLRLAVQLLTMTDKTGTVVIEHVDFLQLCGIKSIGAALKRLTELQAREIAHYSTNDRIYITFHAWHTNPLQPVDPDALSDDEIDPTRRNQRVHAPKPARTRAETSAREDVQGLSTRRNQRVHAPKPARTRAETSALDKSSPYIPIGIGMVGRYLTDLPTYLPAGENGEQQPPGPDEQRQTVALLTDPDVSVSGGQAARIAEAMHFCYIVGQVAAWWLEPDTGPGALVNRIKDPEQFPPRAKAPPQFLASDLWRRHYPLNQDKAATRRRLRDYSLPGDLDPPDFILDGWNPYT